MARELELATRKKFPNYGVSREGKACVRRGDMWYLMDSRVNKAGRHVVTFKDINGRNFTVYLHAWVMAGFGKEKPSKGSVVKHRDGDFANNNVTNLYWGQKDSAPKNPSRGENHHKAVLTEEGVRKVRRDLGKKRVRQIAREHNIGAKTVRDIRDHKTWGWLE